MKHYDVVIIGGGPSGSTAAYVLKSVYNLNVLLVDKHAFPREKLCAGLCPKKTTDLIKTIYNKELNVKNAVNTNTVKVFYNYDLISSVDTDIPFTVVNRTNFDYWLLKNYIDIGGEVKYLFTLKSLDPVQKFVSFFNGETYSYTYIIGADGAYSVMRKFVDSKYKKTSFCFEGFAPTISDDEKAISLYFGNVLRGYAWDFYRGESRAIGCGAYARSNCSLHTYKSFLRKLNKENEVEIKGAFIPYDYVKEPVKNDVFLVGDAAGLIDPITGEGIYFAILSGNYAANAIGKFFADTQEAKNDYLKNLKGIHSIIKGGKKLKKYIYSPLVQKIVFKKLKGHNNVFKYACDQTISTYNVLYHNFVKTYKKTKKPNN